MLYYNVYSSAVWLKRTISRVFWWSSIRICIVSSALLTSVEGVGQPSSNGNPTAQSLSATPIFSPSGEVLGSAQIVTIFHATPGPTIYYTSNGGSPTLGSGSHREPITVSSSEPAQATAVVSGRSASAADPAAFTITPTNSFMLSGLTSPATVTESIFVNASTAITATVVRYYIDNLLVDTQNTAPFWMGGGTAARPNGYSLNRLSPGIHKLTATALRSDGSLVDAQVITLQVVPSINQTFSNFIAPYPNQLSAQQQSLNTVLNNISTAGARLTAAEIGVRRDVLAMYLNWGVNPSLDYQNDVSDVLATLTPGGWLRPVSNPPAGPFSLDFSPDAPYYHRIPAQWPRVRLPSGYVSVVQLNTNRGGDGIGFGQSVANRSSPNLTVTSEWYGDATTLVTFSYRIQPSWMKQIPSNPSSDKHLIFIDPFTNSFISSYMTSLDRLTGGPKGLYISKPTSFDSLGTFGGSVAARIAELPVLIQPGEATNPIQPIRHAISGPVSRPWAARVYPAAARDAGILTNTNPCTGSDKINNGLVPYGGLIQLDPALNISQLTLTLPARRILEAMQTYGFYVVDLGCDADLDIYTAIPGSELDPYGGLYGNANGVGVQNELRAVVTRNTLYVVAPLIKKQ